MDGLTQRLCPRQRNDLTPAGTPPAFLVPLRRWGGPHSLFLCVTSVSGRTTTSDTGPLGRRGGGQFQGCSPLDQRTRRWNNDLRLTSSGSLSEMQTLRPTSDLQSEDLHFNKVPSDLLSMKVLFIYLWLCWVFIVVRGLSLVVVSGGYSLLWYAGFSLQLLLLQGSQHMPRLQQLWLAGSRVCGLQELQHMLSSCGSRA